MGERPWRGGQHLGSRFLTARHAIPIEYRPSVAGDYSRTGRDDTSEVQWVGSADAHQLGLLFPPPDLSQRFHGFRAGVLLAVNAGDEAAATDQALGLHPS